MLKRSNIPLILMSHNFSFFTQKKKKKKSQLMSVISDTVFSCSSYVELEEVGMLQLRHCFGKQRKGFPL
jgi:hypothetical protein